MPVTAKLSRKFYEQFGDDIASEFVDWFNAVDATYQTQLREINELNWERFKTALQAEGAAIRSELRGEFHTGLATTEKSLGKEIQQMHRDLQKWMFIYWCGSIIALYGLRFFGPR